MAASDGAATNTNTPKGWIRCTVKDIVYREKNSCVGGPFGSNLTSKDYVDAPGVPVSRGNNLTLGEERYIDRDFVFVSERKATTLLQNTAFPGDLVFTQRGTIGQIGLLPRKARFSAYVLSQNQMKLRPDEGRANSVFLYYYFISPVAQGLIQQNSIGSTIPGFNLGQLRAFPLVLPPLLEQRAIAHILGTLDDKIELNRQMNETLEAMTRALFKSWFVDFDPVRAKVEGRDPGLPKSLADLFPDSFEDSELGQIPKAWEVGLVYRAAEVVYGAAFSSAKFNTDRIGKPLIRIRDLADENPGFFTDEEHPKGYLVKPGDIVVGMDGEFRAHLWGGVESWLNQRVCVFKPKAGFSAPFVLHSIVGLLAEVESTETATTVIHLGKNDIDRFKTVVPAEPALTAFGRLAEPLFQRIVVNKQESRTLAALRDTLLPKLISGEVRVKDAERFVETTV